MQVAKGEDGMRRNLLVIAVALGSCVAVILSAQGKPDFSGKWVLDTSRSTVPPGGGRDAAIQTGVELTIKQDAKTLTLIRTQGDQSTTEILNLDGSETRDTLQTPGGPRERVLSASWDGSKILINGRLNVDGKMLQQTRVMSIESGNLVIEATAPGPGGATTTRLVFKKG
jgi:hypothetical protein